MRKSTRIFKKHIATFLIVLMSINSFGAVVSDNDGSAFITKAEFDSLKNNFQSQIDQYNTSIDSKIDGAIASYLSGIKVVTKETLKPEFKGTRILVTNIEKIDNLKLGKMNFKINSAVLNVDRDVYTSGFAGANGGIGKSSSCGFLNMERMDPNNGVGFEVFRATKDKKLRYFDDLRFSWNASRMVAGRTGSGGSAQTDTLYLRWHAYFGGRQRTNGDLDSDEMNGQRFSDLLSNPSWLGFHQSGGIGLFCTNFPGRDMGYSFDEYVTSVNTFDKGQKWIISTDATNNRTAPIICTFSQADWSTDIITQQESLYQYFDTTSSPFKYTLPSDAGLTKLDAACWSINNWQFWNNLTKDSSGNYTYYHQDRYAPTWFQGGATWTRNGTYNLSPDDPAATIDTANDFYEMIPKMVNVNLSELKNDVALTDVLGNYSDWKGFLYQGLPLYNFDKSGTITLSFDLTDADDDLYMIVRDRPLVKDKSPTDYLTESLDTRIDNIKLDNVDIDHPCMSLTKGNKHEIKIITNEKTAIFYKFVPVDSDSKERNVVFVPDEFEFEQLT